MASDHGITLPQAALRRNYWLGVINGAAFRLSLTLLDGAIVLPWFVSQITASRVIIGLLLPIQNGGWFLPQLFLSRYVQSQRRRLPFYNAACVLRACFWALLAASPFVLGPRRLPAILATVLLSFAGYALVGGATGITFTDLIAQGVEPTRRGSFFAWRNLTGGILAVGGSLLVSQVIGARSSLPFPYNFGLLAVINLAVVLIMSFALSFWTEVDHPPPTVRAGSLSRSVRVILRHDRNLRGFLITRILFIGASVTASFFVVHAAELGGPQQLAGLFLVVYTASELASNLLWGWVSDHMSNKLLLGLIGTLALLQNLWALVFQAGWPPVLYLSIFVLMGLIQSGYMVCSLNLLLEVADPQERPTYVGLANTIMGIATLVLPLGGVVAQLWGLRVLFALAAALALVGLASLVAWQDPRSRSYRRPCLEAMARKPNLAP